MTVKEMEMKLKLAESKIEVLDNYIKVLACDMEKLYRKNSSLEDDVLKLKNKNKPHWF